MKKLLLSSLAIITTLMISAQTSLYSDSKVNVDYFVEDVSDEVNDIFYEYYSFEITNVSQEDISFVPVFSYITESGQVRSSADSDENDVIDLSPGQTIRGDLSNMRGLTLFKEFLIGNSGKRAANSTHTIESISINYQ